MTPEQLEECRSALGVEALAPMTQGGQKLVFRSRLAEMDVVVKVVPLPADQPGRDLVLERAHREVDVLEQVQSDFVVNVLSEAIEVGEPPFAVTWVEELLEGQDLSTLLGPQWSDSATLSLIADSAMALAACHELSVVHRDLSPGNIRRRSSGRFVLMDPGIARHLDRTPITGMYQPGTPGFRSPEHVPGGSPIPASDIFALGLLVHYARSRSHAIDPSGTPNEYDRRLSETQAESIRTRVSDIDEDLADVIDRCLQRQAARRFLDGAELLTVLRQKGMIA